jgi:hypothetical protein
MIFWRRTRGPESRVLDPGSRRPVAGSGADFALARGSIGPDANRGPRPTSVPVFRDSGGSFQWFCRRERRNSKNVRIAVSQAVNIPFFEEYPSCSGREYGGAGPVIFRFARRGTFGS